MEKWGAGEMFQKVIFFFRERETMQPTDFRHDAFRLDSIEVYKKRERRCCDR